MEFNLPFTLPLGWDVKTVECLIAEDILDKPLDGNHGGIHPKSSDYVKFGVPFIMASDLNNGAVDFGTCSFISASQASQLQKGFAKTGDVLLSHKATIGRTAIVQESEFDFIVLTPQITYYRIKNGLKLNNQYLKAYFDSSFFQGILGSWAGSGSTRAYLGITAQLKLPIIVPPIERQYAIAEQLFSINKKIDLNRQTNQTLEQIAQALFKSWFVDFEPTRAKIAAKEAGASPEEIERAAMCAISGKTPDQLAKLPPETQQNLKTTAALFPDALVDSELGEIPAGWEVGTLADLCRLNESSWSEKNAPEEVNYVDLANTKNGIIEEVQRYSWSDAPSRARRILKAGDTIIGTVRPGNRSFTLIGTNEQVLTASTGFAVLSPKKKEYVELLYIASTSNESIDRLAHLADGGAYPAVRPDVVTQLEIVIPSNDLIEIFSKLNRPVFTQLKDNLDENSTLKNLRDTLLPKLLSGEIVLN